MMAGSDFIKTSTGKESVNATFPVAMVMIRAIRDYLEYTGFKIGFKPAGKSRTYLSAQNYYPSYSDCFLLRRLNSQVSLLVVSRLRRYWYNPSPPLLGGIRTAKDSLQWLTLMKEELGDEWVQPHLFRMGASSLLGDIERQLYHYCTGRYASSTYDIAM